MNNGSEVGKIMLLHRQMHRGKVRKKSPDQMLCLAHMLAFICHFKATRQTCITVVFSSVLECRINLHGLGPVCLCVCITVLMLYLPPFSSSFHTLSRSRHKWWAQAVLLFFFSFSFPPHFSNFPQACCAPAFMMKTAVVCSLKRVHTSYSLSHTLPIL